MEKMDPVPQAAWPQASSAQLAGIVAAQTRGSLSWHRKILIGFSVLAGALLCAVVAISIKLATDLKTCSNFSAEDKQLIANVINSPVTPNTWSPVYALSDTPAGRAFAAACAMSTTMYVSGGVFGSDPWSVPYVTYGDLWSYDIVLDTWTEEGQSGSVPAARFQHTLVPLDGSSMVLFGGFNVWSTVGGHASYADLYVYSIGTHVWTRLDTGISGAAPSSRGGHSAVSFNGAMYVYGGQATIGASGQLAELWKFTFGANQWTQLSVSGPEGRTNFNFLPVSTTSFIMTEGDCSTGVNGVCSTSWTYTPSTNAWQAQATVANAGNSVSFGKQTVAAGLVFQYGGYNATTDVVSSQLWAVDPLNNKWMQLFPNFGRGMLPPATYGQAMTTIGNRIFMFGGRTGSSSHPGSNQLWEYFFVPPA